MKGSLYYTLGIMDTAKVGMKRKGDPGDVLNEERAPASPTDSTAGTLRGEHFFHV